MYNLEDHTNECYEVFDFARETGFGYTEVSEGRKVSPGPAILLQQCHLEKKENSKQRLAKQFYVKLNKTLEKSKASLMVAYVEG